MIFHPLTIVTEIQKLSMRYLLNVAI
jgi:hypothetical protein